MDTVAVWEINDLIVLIRKVLNRYSELYSHHINKKMARKVPIDKYLEIFIELLCFRKEQ
jgi:hypothetical protein